MSCRAPGDELTTAERLRKIGDVVLLRAVYVRSTYGFRNCHWLNADSVILEIPIALRIKSSEKKDQEETGRTEGRHFQNKAASCCKRATVLVAPIYVSSVKLVMSVGNIVSAKPSEAG